MTKNKYKQLERRAKWLGILLTYCAGYSEEISPDEFQFAVHCAQQMLDDTVSKIVRCKKSVKMIFC